MDSSPEKLKKELEEELQMSSDDLRSHAWYHGRIPRQVCSFWSHFLEDPGESFVFSLLICRTKSCQHFM